MRTVRSPSPAAETSGSKTTVTEGVARAPEAAQLGGIHEPRSCPMSSASAHSVPASMRGAQHLREKLSVHDARLATVLAAARGSDASEIDSNLILVAFL